MRIFADLCVHSDVIQALIVAGFEVEKALDRGMERTPDEEIFRCALKHSRILLTFDKDFGNIIRFDIKASKGVVIIYVEGMTGQEIIQRTLEFFQSMKDKSLDKTLFVVEKDDVRIWPR